MVFVFCSNLHQPKSIKMKTLSYYFVMLLTSSSLLFTSCKSNAEAGYSSDSLGIESVSKNSAESYAPNSESQKSENSSSTIPIERKLVKEADLSWETNNMSKTHQLLLEKVKKYNAYISNDAQSKDDYQISNSMVIKLPADKFDAFINELQSNVKNFDSKNIRVLDVTEEYIDVEARIKTKKELEQRYTEILKRANTVEEIMSVEAQLNSIRAEIESVEGRMKLLNQQITLSTININFYETTSAPVGFFGNIGKSIIEGWNSFLHFILNLISIWPTILILGGIIYFIYKKIIRRKTNV